MTMESGSFEISVQISAAIAHQATSGGLRERPRKGTQESAYIRIFMREEQEIVPTVFLVSNRQQRRKVQHHCTVSVKLVVGCRGPLVAITVTVDAVAAVVVAEEFDHTPRLQPAHRLSPSATSTNAIIFKPRRFFQPNQQSATASTEPGNNGLELRRRAAVVVAVVIVSVVETSAPDVVTVAGEKLHDAPEGNPEQLKDTAPPNAFCGVTKIVVVPLCPAVTVSDAGETATVKLGVATCVRLMV
jgi:hypothetical protein